MHRGAAVEREAAAGDLQGEPGGMRARADGAAVERQTIGEGEDHRPDDLHAPAAVQRETLQVVDRGRRGAGHA